MPVNYGNIPQIDFSPLAKLGDVYEKNKVAATRERSLAALAQGASPDQIGHMLAQSGDTEGALQFMRMGQMQANRASDVSFRERQAQEAQSRHQEELALKKRALDEGRLPPGFERTETGMRDVPGGPADPNYVQRMLTAKTDPTATMEPEQKLRKEFELNSKTHLDVRRGYERILASKDDAAGDISLIFGFMKMLDPGSVVREGEFATAQNSAGIPDQIRNIYNKALEGTRLQPGQRNMFKGQAQSLYDASDKEHKARVGQFTGISKKYGLDPARVIPDLGDAPTQSVQQKTDAAPPMSALKEGVHTTFKNGQTWTLRNGKAEQVQ